jgi:fumarylacetoacetate (FAA) hydrolase family protein
MPLYPDDILPRDPNALLLGKAKDNNAAAAVGPFVRLFDQRFSLAHIEAAEIALMVTGTDGFVLEGRSAMQAISRPPADIVAQAINDHHRYPDGLVLYLGTMFAPTEDRDAEGKGFTHHEGDTVRISCDPLGALINRVTATDACAPWNFGAADLMRNLAARGLL